MNELEERLQMYEKTFGESFPTYPLMLSKTDEEMIEIIDRCLDVEQDVYAMGILKDDSNLKY
jgi:hypothetical protein